MKNILVIVASVIVFILGALALIFYLALRSKNLDVSNERPFSGVVNKKITTKRKIVILKNYVQPLDKNYPFILEDGSGYGFDTTLEVLAEFDAGTEIVLEKAVIHTGGTSGMSIPYVFGRVFSEKNQRGYNFNYTWGNYHFLNQDKPFFSFPLAFWQDDALEEKFYFDLN